MTDDELLGLLEREIAELPHDCSDEEIHRVDACICGVLEQ